MGPARVAKGYMIAGSVDDGKKGGGGAVGSVDTSNVDVDFLSDEDNGLNSPHVFRRKSSKQQKSNSRRSRGSASNAAANAAAAASQSCAASKSNNNKNGGVQLPPETPPAMRRIFSRKNTSAHVPRKRDSSSESETELPSNSLRKMLSAPPGTPPSPEIEHKKEIDKENVEEEPTTPSASAAASILTQTDSSGNQTSVATPTSEIHHTPRFLGSPFLGSMLSSMCCASCVDGYDTGEFLPGAKHNSTPGGRTRVSKKYRSYRKGKQKCKPGAILGPIPPHKEGTICLVLDLDETLVHSSFKPVPAPDYIIPVEIEGTTHNVFVKKRPGVDDFMKSVGERYEIVVYTASLRKYADPLLDQLDIHNVISHRLFRESCTCHQGNYVKDLAVLGRELEQIIIIDNSPASYMFQPQNAIGISSYIDDPEDTELFHCQTFLENICRAPDVVDVLPDYPSFLFNAYAADRSAV